MRKMYRVALYSGVATAALAFAAPAALAQSVVTQSSSNSATVTNPVSGTATIDLGGGGLGAGASVSSSATGASVSTSVIGIGSQFLNPTGGFGTITQGAANNAGANVSNVGAIIGASGDTASASSLSISARGALAAFSIIAEGGIPFVPVANVGNISQGTSPGGPTPAVVNAGTVFNTGEITGPSGGPALDLSGLGATASVSATGTQSSVAVASLGATQFTGTTFGTITQAPNNNGNPVGISVQNTLTNNGVSLGAISGNGAGVSVAATGAAASVSFSYVDTTNWSPALVGTIFQNPINNNANVSNITTNGVVTVGAISGMGASVRAGAAGSVAGISYSSISSTIAVGGQAQSIASVGQVVSNSGLVSNTSQIVGTGLTGAGSSASISALGAGASFSTSSIGDVSSAPLNSGGANVGVSVTQQVTNTGANTVNNGGISLGTGTLANGASASVSATGAQGAISVSSINTQSFTTPLLGGILQTVTNGGASASTVSNSSLGITTGDLSGHGASVSATASGAAASVGVSFINTPAWSSFPLGPVNQNATNTGSVTNGAGLNGQLSVGALSGTGASVRSSATGASASIAVTSILSGPPVANTFGSASMSQLATNTGAIQNTGTIVSSGTLSGMASSASITAVGAATSVALASINDTAVVPAPTATVMNITQTSNNLAGSPVANTGTITLAGGNLGAAAAASIGAVGASAAVSFLAVR